MNENSNQVIILRDGRKFGFAEWGNPNGFPILLFVGGSSRLVRPVVELSDIRLITVDRPGIGLSDYHSKRTLLNLSDDILELVDSLGVRRIAIVGISQGGPSALACAYEIPDRLVAASVVSSLAPLHTGELRKDAEGAVATYARLAKSLPLAFKLQSAVAALMVRISPRWTFQQVLKSLPKSDRSIFDANPELELLFIRDLEETYCQGCRGAALDGLLAYRSWGFNLKDIRVKVNIWHGEDDQTVPITMAHYLEKTIPNCEINYLANEGHFLGLRYWPEIAGQVIKPSN